MGQTTELKIGEINHTTREEGGTPRSYLGGRPKRGLSKGRKVMLLILGLVAVIGLVIGGIAWSHRGLITVQTGKVMRQNLSAIVTASGEIKPPPDKFATVNANSMGKVIEIRVKEGDYVKKGELLLRTEDVQQEASVRAQSAALRSARADSQVQEAAVQSATANLQTAEANLSQAQAKLQQAKDDFSRSQQMFKQELISRQTFDQALSTYQVADATVKSSTAQVAQAKAQLNQATFNACCRPRRSLSALKMPAIRPSTRRPSTGSLLTFPSMRVKT